jgi:hypothetical protein
MRRLRPLPGRDWIAAGLTALAMTGHARERHVLPAQWLRACGAGRQVL